jgi:uncharacterized Zn finger protein (UPF0148 family)
MIPFRAGTYKDFALVKVDETAHTVSGLVTAEVPDKDGEICDYSFAKIAYLDWATEASASTKAAGQDVSYGNMREMHQLQFGIAGKVAAPIVFDDDAKTISLITDPENHIFIKAKQGKVRGFSQGGGYQWRHCNECGHNFAKEGDFSCPKCAKTVQVRYAPAIAEVSYVDNPCLKIATFDMVKADGTHEMRKFAEEGHMKDAVEKAAGPLDIESLVARFQKAVLDGLAKKDAKTKRKAGEDLTADAFAHVGDKDDPSTWKLPIKFSTDEKSKTHIRNALARLGQTEGMSDDEKASAKTKIHAAAKKHGIDVEADEAKAAKVAKACAGVLAKAEGRHALAKGMYDVSRFASLLQDVCWLWQDSIWEADFEGDDSELPEELRGHIESLAETFLSMAEEEVKELTAKAGDKGVIKLMKTTEAALAKAHSAVAHLHKMEECIKGQHDTMMGHCAKMHKILGTEEAAELAGGGGDGKAEPIDLEAGGAQTDYGKAAAEKAAAEKAAAGAGADMLSMSKADFAAAVEKGVEDVFARLVKAVEEDQEKEKTNEEIAADAKETPVKKAAAGGIGDRRNMPVVIANGGPHIRVMPVTKAQDGAAAGGATAAAALTKADIDAAVNRGDESSILKLMKSARPQNDVPATLVGALSKL